MKSLVKMNPKAKPRLFVQYGLSTLLVGQLISSSAFAELSPAPTLTPGPSTDVTQAKKQLNVQELQLKAGLAAETFARDVLEIIGQAYKVRYNVREGLLAAMQKYGDFSNLQVVQSSNDYRNAYSEGSIEARTQGLKAGEDQARSTSALMAQEDLNRAVDVAINTGKPIQFKPTPKVPPFAGVQAQISKPVDLNSRILNSYQPLVRDARELLDHRFPSELLRRVFDISAIRQGHETTVPEVFRSDAAFENWKRNILQSSSSNYSEGYRYLSEISNANIYENPAENERLFRQALVYAYSRALENTWLDKVRQSSSVSQGLGRDLYQNSAVEYATELGRYDGFNLQFTSSSVESFNAQMKSGQYYTLAFNDTVTKIKTSSYVGSEVVRITSEENLPQLTLGDTIDIFVDQLTNRGMKAGSVQITPMASAQVTVMGNGGTVEIPGMTRLNVNKRFQRQLWISEIKEADEVVTVNVQVGSKMIQQQFKLTLEAMIKKSSRPNDQYGILLMKKVSELMRAQYDSINGFHDQFAKRRGDMYLVRMSELFKTFNESQKNELRKHGQIIRDAFGGKPSKFLNPKRNDWEETQKMIEEMGLLGSEPSQVNP